MCGIAGALYVPQVGIINPSEMSPANSIEIAIWTAIGGRGTLIGPVFGAATVNLGKSWFTQALPEYWLYALGSIFVIVTLFLPNGLVGICFARRSAMTNTVVASRARGRPRASSAGVDTSHGAILYLEDVSVSFDGFQALNGLSLTRRRRRAALRDRAERRRQDDDDGRHHRQDASGYGHGLLRPDDRLDDAQRAADRAAGIGRKFQKPTVFEQHTRLREPRAGDEGRQAGAATLFARLDSTARIRIRQTLEMIRLDADANASAGLLSHGQKQWLEIGMLLMQEPQLLLLDEPVAGMTDDETDAQRRAVP